MPGLWEMYTRSSFPDDGIFLYTDTKCKGIYLCVYHIPSYYETHAEAIIIN